MKIQSAQDLAKISEVYQEKLYRPGRIKVNIGMASCGIAAGAMDAYSTAKAALIGFTKSVAVDFVTRGIRVNAVCPGAVQTPGLESRIAASEDPHATRAAFVGRHKMGRLGTVEEVAAACLYLASAESSFMTGQMLVVDGGMTL